MALFTAFGQRLYVCSSMSANTGLAPQLKMAFAVAIKVIGVVMTSSPGDTPIAARARHKADVPLLTAHAKRAPTNLANSCSNARVSGPLAIIPLLITLVTASISSCPRRGCAILIDMGPPQNLSLSNLLLN